MVQIQLDKISIHALREEGDWDCYEVLAEDPVISIHALREEGDLPEQQLVAVDDVISIHALREEGDRCSSTRCCS